MPGSIEVSAQASPATALGITTPDGWEVRFDRFVTAIGDIDLNSEDGGEDEGTCTDYSETHYEKLFDFTVAAPEKVGLVYGLGVCSVEFRFRDPSDETILTPGVTGADREMLEIEASDPYIDEPEETAVLAIGRGSRDGVVKRFEWMFRRSYEIEKCQPGYIGGPSSVVELSGEDALSMAIEVRGEELFRSAPIENAGFHFTPFAEADLDGDDRISFEELGEVDAPEASLVGEDGEPLDLGSTAPTLADLVYEVMLPRIARFAGGGPCEPELRDRF